MSGAQGLELAQTSGAPIQQATQSRVIQATLAAAVARDVAQLWPNLDRKRLEASFPGWLEMMIALVYRYHGMSSLAASIFYRDARQAHLGVPTPDGVVKTPAAPSADWMTQAFGFSGPGLLRNGAYKDSSALSTTQGTAVRLALAGGRDTVLESVKADPKALGWYRVTDGAPCAFCALLASRGVVEKSTLYRSEHSFDASNARFTGAGAAKVHNDCSCTMAPAFSRTQPLPATSHKAAEIYANRGDGPALAAFRKAWNAHLAASADTAQPAPVAPAA